MPKSRIFLPDVNVWLALASRRHVHCQAAVEWLDTVGDREAAFCRVTQMGLLRLLTNAPTMGPDVVGPATAWGVYGRMTTDLRVQFLSEPPGIEMLWQQLTKTPQAVRNLWTDAYLQAFAQLKDVRVVSFDRDFQRFPGPAAMILRG